MVEPPVMPEYSAEYGDRTTAAVKSVLLEIGQILGSYKGRYAVVGGAVPWLLLDNDDMPHIGTIDIDLSLRPEQLGAYEYTGLVESLMDAGYVQQKNLRPFQLVRTVPGRNGEPDIDIIVDFLMPRDAVITKTAKPILENFAVMRADGAELAGRYYELVAIDGTMPDGGTNRVEIAVASIPALLAMKGYAVKNRMKLKDAYDIYYCIRNFQGGAQAAAEACRPLLEWEEGKVGYGNIAEKFDKPEGYGPTSVRQFVERSNALGDRTAEQWQEDAFGQVDLWLKTLGLR
jgi:hypothetical protein